MIGHHLTEVRVVDPGPDVAKLLGSLVDIGRDIVARNTVAVIPDAEITLAGQRVEHIATVIARHLATQAAQVVAG